MRKLIDFNKTYAIALGGGGAKGGYEVGVWRSLLEEGLKYNAVSGTSVGALNGAMMAMRDLDGAEALWRNIRFSDIMDVDDEIMNKLFEREATAKEIRFSIRKAMSIVRGGGLDVTPLRENMHRMIDPLKIKNADVDFIVVTYSLTDKKGLDIDMRTLPTEEICDMLLASAYYPAFKNEPLTDGKRYTDGGFSDSLPITPLIKRGYKDIIAIRLSGGFGREKKVKAGKDVSIDYIEPKRKLGQTMNFSPVQSAYNISLGYYDAKRYVYGLLGDFYYIERTMTEDEAYKELMSLVREQVIQADPNASLRLIHEEILPRIAKKYNAFGDYYDILIHYLEHTGEAFKLPEFRIVTDTQLLNEVKGCLTDKKAAEGES